MDLIISQSPDGAAEARCGEQLWRCAIGRGGLSYEKREGDGATPIGSWPVRFLYYRTDRIQPVPRTSLAVRRLRPLDGWCDDPTHSDYNRPVTLPFDGRHEVLWRGDNLYDLIVVLGYNDNPPVTGMGSAIFLHLTKPDYGPTEGCVALARDHLISFLGATDSEGRVTVMPPA